VTFKTPVFGHRYVKVAEVHWCEETRSWTVQARAGEGSGWTHYDGHEGELDDLLAIARDTMTGG
jgi:hypothetical protein